MPEGYFCSEATIMSGEAAIVRGEAAIEIVASPLTIAVSLQKKNPLAPRVTSIKLTCSKVP